MTTDSSRHTRTLADHPVAVEFDLGSNAPLVPSDLAWGSKTSVWWRCSSIPDHGTWQATVNNRTKPQGTGCPACRGNHLAGMVPPDRSLQGRYPHVAAELDAEKSGFTGDEVTYGSKRVAWWKCPQGHAYQMTVNQRTHATRPQACSYCAGKKVAPERSLAAVAPEVAVELNADRSGITARELMSSSNQKVWWRCSANPAHEWEATPGNRVGRGSGCPDCTGTRVSDANRLSLHSPSPRLLDEWDYERNQPLTPGDVSIGSSQEVWWRCSKTADHDWPDSISHRVRGRGCPYCAGNRVSSTNRLSDLRPEIARELDTEASGVTADQLSVGSNREVIWKCTVDSRHVWPATVLNRTGGHHGGGTRCPFCKLVGTSAQELQLKAELAAVLPIDLATSTVLNANGRPELVDIVLAEPSTDLQVIVEFDGRWWHGHPLAEARDTAKTLRLQEAGWKVIRVREAPLALLDKEWDVVVQPDAPVTQVAATVLNRLAERNLIAATLVQRYRKLSAVGPVDRDLARELILKRLGEQHRVVRHQSQTDAWNRMYAALGTFADQHGHCRVPEDVEVAGVNLARWVHKQRTLYRQGALPADRADRLQEIPTWSFDSPRVEDFWSRQASYLEAVTNHGAPMPRPAVWWASNLRKRRLQLQVAGRDLPRYQLDAMAEIPGWRWSPSYENFQEKLRLLKQYLAETGISVARVKQRDQWGEHKIGTWINSWRTRREQLPEEHCHELEGLPGWTWNTRADRWDEGFQRLCDFARTHGHAKPSICSPDEHERAVAMWKRNNKNRLQGRTDERATKLRRLLAAYGEELP